MDQKYLDKFWSKVDIKKKHECWPWTGGIDRDGYGRMPFVKGIGDRAHRISAIIHGMGPGKDCVCHTCDNARCVNPNHLFIATVEENNKDRSKKGRTRNQYSLDKVERWR